MHKHAKSWILLGFFFLIAILIAEVLTRVVCYSKNGEKICRFDFPETDNLEKYWIEHFDPYFGIWHQSNASFKHVKSCFNVSYETNSYGARDLEREYHTKRPLLSSNQFKSRVVVLGDSWVEGYGSNGMFTLTAYLEKQNGLEFLNFGVSKSSPLQHLRRYSFLVKQFDHSIVMFGILPFNDFDEMDYELGTNKYPNQSRMYIVGKYPEYKIISYDHISEIGGVVKNIKIWLRENSFFYNFIKYVQAIVIAKKNHRNTLSSVGDSRYYNFSDEDFLRLKWVLEKLIKEVGNKKVVFITFPTLGDIIYYKATPKDIPLLSKRIEKWMNEINRPNLTYIDLLPPMANLAQDVSQLFLPCDGHMSSYGNEMASKILSEKLKILFLSSDKVK